MPRHKISSELSIAQLEKLLQARRSKIVALERKRAKLTRKLDALDAQITALGGSPQSRRGRVRNKVSLNECIATILKDAGGPMKVAEIVAEVLATGYSTSSDNFRGIVNQALIKDKRFVKSGVRGSYQLKK